MIGAWVLIVPILVFAALVAYALAADVAAYFYAARRLRQLENEDPEGRYLAESRLYPRTRR
jgi:hypothetical protein